MENFHRVGFPKAKPGMRTWVQVVSVREGEGVPGSRRERQGRGKSIGIQWKIHRKVSECVSRLLLQAMGLIPKGTLECAQKAPQT